MMGGLEAEVTATLSAPADLRGPWREWQNDCVPVRSCRALVAARAGAMRAHAGGSDRAAMLRPVM